MDFLTSRMIGMILILVAVILEAGGDILFKLFSLENKYIFFFIGYAIYITGGVFWAISLKYDLLSRAVSIFTVLNLVFVVLIGVFFFKEDLSLMNKLGVALGILSVILLEL